MPAPFQSCSSLIHLNAGQGVRADVAVTCLDLRAAVWRAGGNSGGPAFNADRDCCGIAFQSLKVCCSVMLMHIPCAG